MRVYAKTDIGKARQMNQDFYYVSQVNENMTLCILADGMGGYNGGEIASSLATNSSKEYIEENFEKIGHSDEEIMNLIRNCNYWVSVDNFLQHMAHHISKPGVVLWGRSDPRIFGYSENINIIKNIDHLREKQFWFWEDIEYNPNIYYTPQEVIKLIPF